MTLGVTINRIGSKVLHTVTGTQAEVEREVRRIFHSYNPIGYGTTTVTENEPCTQGVRTVVSRWHSCD